MTRRDWFQRLLVAPFVPAVAAKFRPTPRLDWYGRNFLYKVSGTPYWSRDIYKDIIQPAAGKTVQFFRYRQVGPATFSAKFLDRPPR